MAQTQDTPSDSPAESLQSGAQRPVEVPEDPRSDEELRAAYLAFMRDHTTEDTAVRPMAVWDALGAEPFSDRIGSILTQILGEGLLAPAIGGWYLPNAV